MSDLLLHLRSPPIPATAFVRNGVSGGMMAASSPITSLSPSISAPLPSPSSLPPTTSTSSSGSSLLSAAANAIYGLATTHLPSVHSANNLNQMIEQTPAAALSSSNEEASGVPPHHHHSLLHSIHHSYPSGSSLTPASSSSTPSSSTLIHSSSASNLQNVLYTNNHHPANHSNPAAAAAAAAAASGGIPRQLSPGVTGLNHNHSSSNPLSKEDKLASATVQHKVLSAQHVRLGNASFTNKEYEKAVAHYTISLEYYDDDPRTWNNRATSYVALKLFRMGIRDYTEAISRAPNIADFYYKRGFALSSVKQYMLAILDYTRCLELRQDHSDAWNNRGNAYRILSMHELAIHDLTRAVQLQPSSQLYQSNLNRAKHAQQAFALTQQPGIKNPNATVPVVHTPLSTNTPLGKSMFSTPSPYPSGSFNPSASASSMSQLSSSTLAALSPSSLSPHKLKKQKLNHESEGGTVPRTGSNLSSLIGANSNNNHPLNHPNNASSRPRRKPGTHPYMNDTYAFTSTHSNRRYSGDTPVGAHPNAYDHHAEGGGGGVGGVMRTQTPGTLALNLAMGGVDDDMMNNNNPNVTALLGHHNPLLVNKRRREITGTPILATELPAGSTDDIGMYFAADDDGTTAGIPNPSGTPGLPLAAGSSLGNLMGVNLGPGAPLPTSTTPGLGVVPRRSSTPNLAMLGGNALSTPTPNNNGTGNINLNIMNETPLWNPLVSPMSAAGPSPSPPPNSQSSSSAPSSNPPAHLQAAVAASLAPVDPARSLSASKPKIPVPSSKWEP